MRQHSSGLVWGILGMEQKLPLFLVVYVDNSVRMLVLGVKTLAKNAAIGVEFDPEECQRFWCAASRRQRGGWLQEPPGDSARTLPSTARIWSH